MKKIIFTLTALFTLVLNINAISYTQARDKALFLTDKMAYELGLSSGQYDAVYEINLDYIMALGSSSDVSGVYWTRRNLDLGYVLSHTQYNRYVAAEYFYRPVYWSSGWRYRIYNKYTNRSTFYYSRPSVYSTYKGGHSWRSNGGQSWYKGRTYTGKRMKTTGKPTVMPAIKDKPAKSVRPVRTTGSAKKGETKTKKTVKSGKKTTSAPSTNWRTGTSVR